MSSRAKRGICSLALAEAYQESRAGARSYSSRQEERERARAAHATSYRTGSAVSESEQQIPRFARDDSCYFFFFAGAFFASLKTIVFPSGAQANCTLALCCTALIASFGESSGA